MKVPGAGVALYTRCTDSFFAPVDGYQDANPTIVHNETIYVSPSQIPYVPVNKWMIHFRVESDAEGQNLEYYYGGKIKAALSRQGISEFEVGLETNGNTVVVINIGRFVIDAQNNCPNSRGRFTHFWDAPGLACGPTFVLTKITTLGQTMIYIHGCILNFSMV
jgi:hypothetical protein